MKVNGVPAPIGMLRPTAQFLLKISNDRHLAHQACFPIEHLNMYFYPIAS